LARRILVKPTTLAPVLQEVSFSVRQGETVCLLGRSGTGKSVTLKLLIGLLRPDIGKVLIGQENISSLEGDELSRLRRKMGFLFQSAALFDSATLEENLALPLRRLTDKSQLEIEFAVHRALAEVGLAADRYKMPGELSGGMKKRAGLARALVLEPAFLLVDEPSSGLDRITASEIDDLLLEQKAKRQTTIVIVTHDVRGARRVGDRFAVLDKARLVVFGDLQYLENHESKTVRTLVGDLRIRESRKCMNFTDKEWRTYDRRQDAPKSNRLHACHALMRLRTSATSQIIGKRWLLVEKALRADRRQTFPWDYFRVARHSGAPSKPMA
jgi:phospholipid/cholesterol/gamma-HCH transport system ATP-binding protein